MNRYTLLHLGRNGDIAAREELDFKDDLGALDHARKVYTDRDVEVWEGTRLAVHIDGRTGEGNLGRVLDMPPMAGS